MRVTVTFPSYNQRRYGKPWIAKVLDWPIGKAPTLSFGGLVGLTVEINAAPTDIVRWGQRDTRGNHTASRWGIVQADGSVQECDPETARNHWLDQAAKLNAA